MSSRASPVLIRPMTEADVEAGLGLVMKVFDEFVAPDLRPEGVASFAAWANPAALTERLRGACMALVAVRRDRVVGVIEWLLPDHLAMLFVDPVVQGEGVGRRLLEEALGRIRAAHPSVRTVEVHASRYALPFYRRLGFRETGAEQERDGILFTPMSLELAPRD